MVEDACPRYGVDRLWLFSEPNALFFGCLGVDLLDTDSFDAN
jgi:hypothetical protein